MGDALPNSCCLIPWLGELSPRKAVGLLGPGQTGGPKVHGTNVPMKRTGERRGDSDHGITVLLRANYVPYLAVASAFICDKCKKNCSLSTSYNGEMTHRKRQK